MGRLIEGEWQDVWYDTKESGGRFVRQESCFRDRVTADGSSGFRAERGRYHLYAAAACPWAHRARIFRALKGLEDVVTVSLVHPHMLEHGWSFTEELPDHLFGARRLHEIYTRADPRYTGRVTVPVLWDRETGTIVNNESAEIIRMFDCEFDALADPSAPLHGVSLYPAALREEIDAVNARVYETVNNGVYRAGFATTQEAYEEAVRALFETLDWLEERLARQPWLAGDRLTEADWRLFTTLYRFDLVYHYHFKCNLRRLRDYPHLWSYTRALYQAPGVAATCDPASIKAHYFYSHDTVNPHRIVPIGPDIDFDAPHDRDRLGAAAPW